MRGAPFNETEKQILQDYVKSDTDALDILYPIMIPKIEHPRLALFRSSYVKAVSYIERYGIPLCPQVHMLKELLKERLPQLIEQVDKQYGVYVDGTFTHTLFADYLDREGIDSWPETASGQLSTDKQVFSDFSDIYPQLANLKELRKTISDVGDFKLAIGPDNRNRTGIRQFTSKTGRNQPSGNQFLFNCSKWMRYLVKPIPGHTIVNLDYKAQEIEIAATLSKDPQMMIDYATGDPYLAMGKLARRIPPDGTKESHGEIRNRFKALSLGITYMMGLETRARRSKGSLTEAGSLMSFHKQKYRTFWRWIESEVSGALLTKKIMTS